jgi:NADH dehydrogenase/putative oxidoreductase
MVSPIGWSQDLLPRIVGFHAQLFRRIGSIGGPILDVIVRLSLAQQFFVSGLLKVTNWQAALYLSQNLYPVSWMNPVTAAYVGVTIELVCPVLLAAGLLTRYAAAAMLILSLVVQFNYNAVDSQLFSAALLGWLVVNGAGAFSLDALLRRGLADSAVPLAATVMRASNWVRVHGGPLYLSAVRVWLAAAMLLATAPSLPLLHASDTSTMARWLPLKVAALWPSRALIAAGVVLLLGCLTRYLSAGLAALSFGAVAMLALDANEAYLCATLALLTIFGGGILSADAALMQLLRRRFPELTGKAAFALDGLPRVVIVGGGFGGLSCARALRHARVSVTLIDRDNYHLFQPLLYQVATAGLSPGDIASPIRQLFRECFNTRVLLGTVIGVDTMRQQVLLANQEIPYDFLVLATGAAHSYFGKDQWQSYAPGLKRIEDATAIRRRLLTAFERAEATDDAEERRALLTFLIVGAGPTGVELAGAIAELARFGMEKDFRRFDPANARIVLVQSAPRILPAFDERLAVIAQRSLQRLGVEVLVGSRVDKIDAAGVSIGATRIPARTVLWAAGVMASSAGKWLDAATDGAGRIKVEPDLSVAGHRNIFAIGDTALSTAWNGQPVPGLAPAAKQGGTYVAKLIRARLEGRALPRKFLYRHRGSLATIGRQAAVADFGRIKLWGAPAWWLWGLVHVGFLVGLRNRVATMTNWFWAYLTFGGGIRLITGDDQMPTKQP